MKLEYNFFFAPKNSVLNNPGLPVVGKAKSSAPHTLIFVSTTQKNDPDHGRGEGSEHQLWHTKNMLRLTDKKKISLNNWLDLACLNNYIVENRTDSGNEKV